MSKGKWNNIFKMMVNIKKNPKNIALTLENTLFLNLKEDEKREYLLLKGNLLSFRRHLEKHSKRKLMHQKIITLSKKGKDRKRTKEEEFFWKGFIIYMERILVFIPKLANFSKKIKNKKNLDNFEIYTLSNIYRSLAELSKNILREPVLRRLEVIRSDSPKRIKQCKYFEEKIKEDRLTLELLREILELSDKENFSKEYQLENEFKKAFDYDKRGKSFYLRNQNAHEKMLFSEINLSLLKEGIQKINRFNIALIQVFYLEPIGNLSTNETFLPIEGIFKPIIPKKYGFLLKLSGLKY